MTEALEGLTFTEQRRHMLEVSEYVAKLVSSGPLSIDDAKARTAQDLLVPSDEVDYGLAYGQSRNMFRLRRDRKIYASA